MAKESFFVTKDFDAQIVRTVLKRHWWLMALCLIIAGVTSFFYLRYTKPVYQSNMLIQLESKDRAKDIFQIESINPDPSSFSSDIELLRSQLLFELALRNMDINVSTYLKGNILTEERYRQGSFNVRAYELKDSSLIDLPINVTFKNQKISLDYLKGTQKFTTSGKSGEHFVTPHFDIVVNVSSYEGLNELLNQNEFYFTFNSIESLSSKFLKNLTITPLDPNAQTIDLQFRAYNPVFCRDLLNSLSNSFFNYDLELKKRSSDNILNFIDTQLDSLSIELITSKDSLMTFQRRSNLINPESGSDKLGSKAIILQEEMIAIEVEMRLLSDVESQIKSSPNRLDIYRLIPEFTGMRYSTSLSREVEDLHKIMETKEDLLYVVTDNNPEIISINQKIKSKTASILRSIDIVQNRLLKNGRVLRDKLAEVEAAMYKMPEKKMEYSRLKNIQDLNEKYFSMLTEKKVIYGISEAGYSSSNRVLRRAEVADNPVKPNKGKVYSALFAIGTILGVVILFLFYVSFNEISYLDDLKKILPSSMSYLGTIPLAKNETIGFSRLLIAENPKSVLAEALRNIRTNLNFVDNEYKTIAITSSISGEGKTFVALNLAGIIAISGKKVALIDLDLRKPKVHLALGVDNIIGMSTVIIKQSTWQECVQKSEVENLDVITAGPLPPNPSELILSREFSKVISEMEKVYDVIIFDNPPIGIVSDGVSVMTKADVPIYVFKSHFSKRSFTERVIELTEVQKVKKLSIILNGVISTNNSYGYQYAENSDYFEENIKKKSFLKRILGR